MLMMNKEEEEVSGKIIVSLNSFTQSLVKSNFFTFVYAIYLQ